MARATAWTPHQLPIVVLAAAILFPALASGQARDTRQNYAAPLPTGAETAPLDVQVDVGGGTQASVGFETFESGLAPYGTWVTVDRLGRVWRPRAPVGWRPYYYGRWEWTNEGWLWVSDESFGWAVYHYGRWAWDGRNGWIWVPGYQWAPAWVIWRASGDVVGWAPLGPGLSVYADSYPFIDSYWTFVPCGAFVGFPVFRYAYDPYYSRQFFYRTAPAPARPPLSPGHAVAPALPAWGGPSPRMVEERTGRAVTPVRVVPFSRPGPGPGAAVRPGEVGVFRPGPGAPPRPILRGPPVGRPLGGRGMGGGRGHR